MAQATKSGENKNVAKNIKLYTWGNKVHKQKPLPSDFNLCVTGVNSYKPKGINLKDVDGRDARLQEKVARQPKFEMYMKSTLEKIEKEKPKVVSINCHKGRHRSVAFAELLSIQLVALGYTVTIQHVDV